MGRRELRERIFLLLFRVEFNRLEEMPDQVKMFFEDDEYECSEKDTIYITEKYNKISERLPELDGLLGKKVKGWDLVRMGKVELTILRLALYEVNFDEDVPVSVAINEAVELAKKFGQDSSGSFVNAILAKFA